MLLETSILLLVYLEPLEPVEIGYWTDIVDVEDDALMDSTNVSE